MYQLIKRGTTAAPTVTETLHFERDRTIDYTLAAKVYPTEYATYKAVIRLRVDMILLKNTKLVQFTTTTSQTKQSQQMQQILKNQSLHLDHGLQ